VSAGWRIVDPEGTLEHELARGASQMSVALTYRLAILASVKGDDVDFARMNDAIVKRWPHPTALQRIKAQAHKAFCVRGDLRVRHSERTKYCAPCLRRMGILPAPASAPGNENEEAGR
jgi:hypothetical protein